ncbi:MAG: hypothetical protein DMF69_23085 [Acidobacteria bacterium]|nr:MAG: hypothetical protein DMF69_23085 [Acidobacteriota bacterium]
MCQAFDFAIRSVSAGRPLINFNRVTHHPQVGLFKLCSSSIFVLFHPATIILRVGSVDDNLHQIVADDYFA